MHGAGPVLQAAAASRGCRLWRVDAAVNGAGMMLRAAGRATLYCTAFSSAGQA